MLVLEDEHGNPGVESFMVDNVLLDVAPDESRIINVTFMPRGFGEHNAVLSLLSNDPETPVVEIALNRNGVAGVAPTVIRPIIDVQIDEDSEPVEIADLDEVFYDEDGGQLRYYILDSDERLNLSVNDENWLAAAPDADYNASNAIVTTVQATDGAGQSTVTSFLVSINSINDAPGNFSLVGPVGQQDLDPVSSLDLVLDFSWEKAIQNPYERDYVYYQIHFTSDQNELVYHTERQGVTEYPNMSLQQLASLLGIDLMDSPTITWWVTAEDGEAEIVESDERFSLTFGIPERDLSVSHINPSDYSILSAYPNPFNSFTTVRFGLQNSDNVKVSVYDSNGKEIAVLSSAYLTAGSHSFTWDANNVATGVYFVKVTTSASQDILRTILLR